MLITPSALTTSFYCSFLISHFFFSPRRWFFPLRRALAAPSRPRVPAPSSSRSPVGYRFRRAWTRRRVMGLKVCIPITEKRIVAHSRVIARARAPVRFASVSAATWQRETGSDRRSYITVAFVTATCLCFRLVFAILSYVRALRPLRRPEPQTPRETSGVAAIADRARLPLPRALP